MLTTLKLNDTLVSKLERRDNDIISFERLTWEYIFHTTIQQYLVNYRINCHKVIN